MILRSLLFIPGDSGAKLAKADGCGADAVILDLEDSVAPGRKADARARVSDLLRERPLGRRTGQLWVRVNPLGGEHVLADLAAVVGARPDGVMLPKAEGPADIVRLGHYLDALEAASGLPVGGVSILPVATETALAPFRLGDYAGTALPRLLGLTWGAEDLSAALSAATNLDPGGGWASTYRLVRSLTLLGAHAAGVEAIETLHAGFRDLDGLAASSRAARTEGFSGRLAIHPAQVEVINAAFTPSQAEVDRARRVVEAFAAAPEAGVVGLDGAMLDAPHLKQAQRTLALAARPTPPG